MKIKVLKVFLNATWKANFQDDRRILTVAVILFGELAKHWLANKIS